MVTKEDEKITNLSPLAKEISKIHCTSGADKDCAIGGWLFGCDACQQYLLSLCTS